MYIYYVVHNNRTKSDTLNSILPELAHVQSEVRYRQLSGNTHKQQQYYHLTHVQLHVQNFPFLPCTYSVEKNCFIGKSTITIRMMRF